MAGGPLRQYAGRCPGRADHSGTAVYPPAGWV